MVKRNIYNKNSSGELPHFNDLRFVVLIRDNVKQDKIWIEREYCDNNVSENDLVTLEISILTVYLKSDIRQNSFLFFQLTLCWLYCKNVNFLDVKLTKIVIKYFMMNLIFIFFSMIVFLIRVNILILKTPNISLDE